MMDEINTKSNYLVCREAGTKKITVLTVHKSVFVHKSISFLGKKNYENNFPFEPVLTNIIQAVLLTESF